MARPAQLPAWASSGANILEPSAGKKSAGWVAGERPPAGWWNWWQRLVYDWVSYLDTTVISNKAAIESSLAAARVADAATTASLLAAARAADAAALALQTEVGAILSPIDRATGGANVQYAFAALTLSYGTPRLVSCGAAGSIYSSDDGGKTWTARTPAGGFSGAFAAAATVGARVYIAGANGTVQSSDDGASWTTRTSGFGTNAVNAIAYRKATGDAVIVGVNGANGYKAAGADNFTANASPLVSSSFVITGVAVADGQPFVCIGVGGGATRANYLFRSTTNGTSWTAVDVTAQLSSIETLYKITYSERLGFVCLVRSANTTVVAVIVSTDGGATWTRKGVLSQTYGQIAGTRGGIVCMSDLNGLYSADGSTWVAIPYLRTIQPDSFSIVELGGARVAIAGVSVGGGLVVSPPWVY